MIETRRARFRRGRAAAFAAAHLLTFTASACSEGDAVAPVRRGRGPLVAPYTAITACSPEIYRGPETQLYSDRPYHTTETIDAAVGRAFCRGPRHGTQVWLLAVERPTTLLAFGTADNGLEERGWTRLDAPLRVEAAGVVFDTAYLLDVDVGRHAIRQAFTPSAPIVLWDPASAHPVP